MTTEATKMVRACCLLATTIFSTLLLVTPTSGSGVCGSAASVVSYSAPIKKAAVVSYSAPAVSYVQQAVQYEQVYYPKAVKAAISPDFYSSVQDYYQQKVLLDAVTGRFTEALKLQEELQSLRQQVQQLQSVPAPAPPLLPQRLPATQQPEYMPPASQQHQHEYPKQEAPLPSASSQPQSLNHGGIPERLVGVVKQSCIRCHGTTYERNGGGLDLRDLNGIDRETRLLCYTAVVTNEMPRGQKSLVEEDKQEFLKWYQMARALQAKC